LLGDAGTSQIPNQRVAEAQREKEGSRGHGQRGCHRRLLYSTGGLLRKGPRSLRGITRLLAQQKRDPGAVGAPRVGNALQVGIGGLVVQRICLAHGASKAWLEAG